jgi:hypothetical protein
MEIRNPKTIAARLTQVFVTLALFVLGLRVVFSLLDADLTNGFVRWVYETSIPLMSPVRGIFDTIVVSNGHNLELPVLFAMMAYAVLAVVVMGVIAWMPEAKPAKK